MTKLVEYNEANPIEYTFPPIFFIKADIQQLGTLESGIDVGQLINIGPGQFGKKNKHRACFM